MFIVTFAICAVFIVVATITFGKGLVNLQRGKTNAQSVMTTGFTIGIWGIFVAAVVFGFFNI